ncbi:MAG: acetyl-CoA carboxylase biotin carboxyl carrier protein [Candidatus Marinimicrobia bacterium]|nr:acetyl-CoA carboxylase biotin carboxyl carrier protein [Candidatus Neomarinimicrobiota bacterium]MBL7046952.1 acetyl-CoA carboxylase biotin carboxyl carrier protein [Candidatus Neomarinimicrobiota bacterium]
MWQGRLKKIISILEESSVNEIEVSFFGKRFRVTKGENVSSPGNRDLATQTIESISPTSLEESLHGEDKLEEDISPNNVVTSPIVGTFYRAPAPDAPSFANVGDDVSVGQTLCIIEAMKIMNEIESEISGRIAKIFVENEEPVEYGQNLFMIEPS